MTQSDAITSQDPIDPIGDDPIASEPIDPDEPVLADTASDTDIAADAPAPDPPDESDEPDVPINASTVTEAILFAADEPVDPKKLADLVGIDGGVKEIRNIVEALNAEYAESERAFRIESIAGGYQMLTLPAFNSWLKQLLKVRSEHKLSAAGLETLAIIAYKQPVLRVDIEAIRGVACGEMVRQLIDKGLVKIVGRAEVLGRPLLYGTTRKFLEIFGLNSLKDLPAEMPEGMIASEAPAAEDTDTGTDADAPSVVDPTADTADAPDDPTPESPDSSAATVPDSEEPLDSDPPDDSEVDKS